MGGIVYYLNFRVIGQHCWYLFRLLDYSPFMGTLTKTHTFRERRQLVRQAAGTTRHEVAFAVSPKGWPLVSGE